MRYQAIDPNLFISNRSRLQEQLQPGQAVVLRAAKPLPAAIDESASYRQDSNFFWATGIGQTGCLLVLSSDAEVLYLHRPNEFERQWLDEWLSLEKAAELSGVADVRWMGSYRKPSGTINATEIIANLRAVKHPIEIELIKRSVAITAEGLAALAGAVKPGMVEYEAEADFTRELIRRGAANAWPPVVASGPNTCTIHYGINNRIMQAGDLLLVDVGAEYGHYVADISRTYPVGGKFSQRQREVYEAVWGLQKAAIAKLKPGIGLQDYEKEMAELMFEKLKSLGVAADKDKEPDKRGWPKWRRFFPHRTSHYLGLDAHDAGDYSQPLQPNVVLTVEPGIYIPEEGIGVRLEDDILITKDGALNLSKDITIEPAEVEVLLEKV